MEDITLLEFIAYISKILSNWFCNIKLIDFIQILLVYLFWRLGIYILENYVVGGLK